MTFHVTIIGGGLAGLCAAIDLSNRAYTVCLIEKNQYPKHKVCGEYISNEVLPYLKSLNIDIDAYSPARIDRFSMSSAKGRTIQSSLGLGGFGMSRYSLDHALYLKAKENGVKLHHHLALKLNREGDQFEVQLDNGQIITSNLVLGAFGKRSNLDKALERDFSKVKSPWLAVKMHYKAEFPKNLVALHHFEGGYGGISMVEKDIVNFCYLANLESFKRCKNVEVFEKSILKKNPKLKAFLDKAEPMWEKPLSISQISFDKKPLIENGVFMLGDAAGLIHPLCGNGMAMAIRSAAILSNLIDEMFRSKSTKEELNLAYKQLWKKNFEARIWWGKKLQNILIQPYTNDSLMRVAKRIPSLITPIIRKTHGKPF